MKAECKAHLFTLWTPGPFCLIWLPPYTRRLHPVPSFLIKPGLITDLGEVNHWRCAISGLMQVSPPGIGKKTWNPGVALRTECVARHTGAQVQAKVYSKEGEESRITGEERAELWGNKRVETLWRSGSLWSSRLWRWLLQVPAWNDWL